MSDNEITKTGLSDRFAEILIDISKVLKIADENVNVLQTVLPLDFFQPQPALIANSFLEYIHSNTDFPVSTVLERFESKSYNSTYQLYHDIRLSAYILLNQLDIASERYINVDRFYKFAAEFILRESYTFNADLHQFSQNNKEESISDFEELLSQDFFKISTSYTFGNSEAYFTTTSTNIPLFTSLNQRSTLDEREIVVPDNLQLTKVLPQTSNILSQSFGALSPAPPRLLQQQQSLSNKSLYDPSKPEQYPQTDILDRFLHPNWYSLPTAKWLQNSDLQSFAPSIDQHTSVVSSDYKGRLWLEHIGYNKLFEINGRKEEAEEEKREVKEALASNADSKPNPELGFEQTEPKQQEYNMSDPTLGSISLENLYNWTPASEIDEDELSAFENGKESELVNSLLLRLSNLRDERIWNKNLQPSFEETKIYNKVTRILKETIIAANTVPDVQLSTYIPILQTNYSGTLPVPTQNTGKKKKSGRR
ncbi:hypothetical protein WICMUC_002707 [Wickerhamomyces mucosus]|uniref:Chromatin structure-remodeling complex protein RSC58 n=1 Tax=Wickerhamomyces mucosus TaxID=1378264 RepID=A0A9P8PN89_9ASCO|nr:hypothetical protein WICMUC_002707 [Wickerhamomyces mucosus]